MALGGGSFTSYNKVLPGTYINFVSSGALTGAVGERGVVAACVELSWGKENEMAEVTAEDFLTNGFKLFGYAYTDDKMKHLRDLFMNAKKAYIYRLGTSVAASCNLCSAKYGGVCGNDIKIKVGKNIDDATYYDVVTYYKNVKRDTQRVKSATELIDNDYVCWKKNVQLGEESWINLAGGSDATVKGEDYQKFLDAAESVRFNTLVLSSTQEEVNNLAAVYTKRMREDRGIKFQSVLYHCEADDIGVINVDTAVYDDDFAPSSLVWFVAGSAAGCDINKSLTNKVYKGSFTISTRYTQNQLEAGLKAGKFMLHLVDSEYRVLSDINSLVTTTSDLGDVFKENQTVRIVDQIAIDDAALFKNKYLGVVPNDEAGRLSLWNDIVEHRKSLEKMRAIENFKDEDIVVEKGMTKTGVVIKSSICPINSMTQLYITTTVE